MVLQNASLPSQRRFSFYHSIFPLYPMSKINGPVDVQPDAVVDTRETGTQMEAAAEVATRVHDVREPVQQAMANRAPRGRKDRYTGERLD